jgi:acyl-CoA reductase-like NAD-dependent aldehyde dehydrogenase
VVAGRERYPDGLGGYFASTHAFRGCHCDIAIAREEILEPVLYILTYRDEDEAVAIDNDYGLTSYAF